MGKSIRNNYEFQNYKKINNFPVYDIITKSLEIVRVAQINIAKIKKNKKHLYIMKLKYSLKL